MDDYDEECIPWPPHRCENVFKRPGMFFMGMDTGEGFAQIIQELVEMALWWRVGSNIKIVLLPDNEVRLMCWTRLPNGEIPVPYQWRRPLNACCDGLAWLSSKNFDITRTFACACQHLFMEIRDELGAATALFKEGACTQANMVAPDLPQKFCLRISLRIGTERLPMTPATLEQVVERIRYLHGPSESTVWGHAAIHDARIGKWYQAWITDPPPRRVV